MELKKYLRYSYVAIAIMTVIALVVCYFAGIALPEWVSPLILKIVAVLLALGILVQTGETAQKLTLSLILQKFASPVTLAALYALYKFMLEVNFAFAQSEWYALIGQVGMIIYGLINDSNNKNALVNDVGKLYEYGEIGEMIELTELAERTAEEPQ